MTASLPRLPQRPADAHKGQFGRVQIIGGSIGMAGAPALAALAALRSGAGLVQVACPREVRTAVATLVPCATIGQFYEADKFNPTVRAVGPGCGDSLSTKDLKWILSEGRTPVVIDADGLNVLAAIDDWWSQIDQNDVLTPHPGEMKRLLKKTSLDVTELKRPDLAREVARLCGGIVVLKGHETVVSDGEKSYINDTGNPGMATGGSGDVLSGMIAALIGQGLLSYDAACVGVHVHGLAGDIAAKRFGPISLIATDIIDALPEAFRNYQGGARVDRS
ncbi:MAG: NAD(P)H-hydrate dehydratase [Planctomycetes bacterium]|nr:NAD(P)H-hydrate dehydratase [Planctomycetota bacterium]